jgi:hypothetical protein
MPPHVATAKRLSWSHSTAKRAIEKLIDLSLLMQVESLPARQRFTIVAKGERKDEAA